MSEPLVDKTFLGRERRTQSDINELQRRRGVPGRLQSAGQQVLDWDTATQAGFFWSAAGAANSPIAGEASGQVLVAGDTIVQEIVDPTDQSVTWRRARISGAWSSWISIAAGGAGSVPVASETVQGKIELATSAEVQTGTDTTRAVTPAGLAARTATETRTGIVELATVAEAQTGTDTVRAVTPAGVAAAVGSLVPLATETVAGKAELATLLEAQLNPGAVDRIMTPQRVLDSIRHFAPAAARARRSVVTTDWNTSQEVGFYRGGFTAANNPPGDTDSSYVGIVHNSGVSEIGFGEVGPITQELVEYTSTTPALYVRSWVRVGSPDLTGTWGPWISDVSSETQRGLVELATAAEVAAGTDAVRVITPASLLARTATDTRTGLIELATGAEVATGTDAVRAVTPLTLLSRTASDIRVGLVELATAAEVQTGTDTTRAVTPAGLAARTATETRTGIAELATSAEVQAGTDATRIVTPAGLASRTATDTRAGLIELATEAEALLGADALRSVSPATLAAVLNALATSDRGILAGDTGRSYRIVSCAIRNSGSGWQVISDAGHEPIGITGVSQDATSITISHAIGATRVIGSALSMDDTLAGLFDAGASVGLSNSILRLTARDNFSDYISHNGTAWVSLAGRMSVSSFSGGTISLTHDNVVLAGGNPFVANVTGREGVTGTYRYQIGSGGVGNTSTSVSVRNAAGTLVATADQNMRFFVDRGPYARLVDPATVDQTSHPGSNIWYTAILEV